MNKLFLTLAIGAAIPVQAAVFTASGAGPGDIQNAVDNFRSALGTNNGVGGSFGSGRREINWDGDADAFASPNAFPGNFFNSNSPRGATFATPGDGFQVSANAASGTPIEFANIDASYSGQFQTFSAERLFTPIGSKDTQIVFFVPGTNIPASVAGFGVVFTDVEATSQTIYTVFYGDGANGGQFAVPVSSSGGLSFLGLTDTRRYSRIIIQTGTNALGAGVVEDVGRTAVDLVAMDDFIYGEPLAINGVPEPGSLLLTLGGVAALFFYRRK